MAGYMYSYCKVNKLREITNFSMLFEEEFN